MQSPGAINIWLLRSHLDLCSAMEWTTTLDILDSRFGRHRCLTEGDRQAHQPSQSQIVSPDQWAGLDLQIDCLARECFKDQLAFDPRQRRSKTEVAGPAKGDVAVYVAA